MPRTANESEEAMNDTSRSKLIMEQPTGSMFQRGMINCTICTRHTIR